MFLRRGVKNGSILIGNKKALFDVILHNVALNSQGLWHENGHIIQYHFLTAIDLIILKHVYLQLNSFIIWKILLEVVEGTKSRFMKISDLMEMLRFGIFIGENDHFAQ